MKKILSILSVILFTGSLWAAEVTVEKTIPELASDNGWVNATSYKSFDLDSVVSVSASNNNGAFYTANNTWRLYQSNNSGQFVISVKKGYVIKSVKLTYSKTNNGVVARNHATTPASNNRINNDGGPYKINATSVTLFVGRSSGSKNASAEISKFTVTYAKLDGVEEAFTNVVQESLATTTWSGDYAEWNVVNALRRSGDILATGVQGTWTKNDGSASSLQTTNAEGGVKHISFCWKQWGTEKDATLKMNVKVGDVFDQTPQVSGVDDETAAIFQFFDQDVNCAKNAQITITNTSKKSKKSGRIVFRDLIITPYLLFTNKTPEADASVVTSFDLKNILINNTEATPSYAVTEFTTGSVAPTITDGVVDFSNVETSGTIKITATWGEVSTTTVLNVTVIPTPTIELEDANVAINGSYVPEPVVKIGETTVQNPSITYTSSNANVATVDGFGNFTLLGTGTSTITATVAAKDNEYKQAQKEITLTVTAVAPEEGTFWKETFSKLATNDGYNTNVTNVVGDGSVYAWNIRYYQRKSNNDDKVYGEYGVRLKYDGGTNNYIEFAGNQEGGIKDLYFKWRLPGNDNKQTVKFNVEVVGNITRYINLTDVAPGGSYHYECAQKLNVEKNAKLKLSVQNGSSPVIFGPISIVPYLLFTNKTPKVDISPSVTSFDLNTILINNTTGDAPTYEVSENSTGSAATIENSEIKLDDVKTSGTMKITATWGQVSTTTTLTVTLPTPTIELENDTVALNGSYVPQPIVKIGEEVVSDPVVTYKSSNKSVATVDASGNFTLLGTGTSTITATVAAKDYAYQQAKKDITLTVTAVAPEEGTFWKETFSKMATVEDYNVERTLVAGDNSVYEWYARNYTHKKTNNDDNIGEEWGVRLGYEEKTNNYIEFNNKQEGGIKDLYFKWRLPGSGNKTVKFNVEVLETTNDFTRSINLTDVAAGKYSTYECAQKLNVEKNAKIKLSVQNGCEAVIFGNILVVPYLLYTQKTDTLDLATATTSKNEALIDNRTDANAIEYSIVSGDATIDEKGTVTTTTVGTVKVQAKWGDVTTTYNLKVINTSQYNLTWNADGGELSGGTPAGLVTVGDALEAPTATKVGYNHTGWDPEVPEVMPANDVTYKATYTAKTCNITLKSNYEGGADDIEFVATYKETSPVTSQAELFTRTGYTIKEGFWKNAESEASGERWVNKTGEYTKGVNGYTDDNRKWIHDAEEDITLYAHWQATSYTITYANMNGATNFEGAPATYTIESSTITLGTPTKTGYNFAGWKVTNAQGEEITEIAQGSTGNKTLWAVWTAKKCNITLKSNYVGGAEDIKFVATYGETSPVAGSAELFTRTNYTIKEGFWKNAESEASGERWVNKTGEYTKSVNGYTDANRKWIHDAEEDITLYAHWTSTMPNISLNDGEDNSATIAANEGKTANVTTNRKVTGGMFNTICLPFDVDAEQMATVFGEDYQLVEFTSATLNEGKNELNIRFNTVEDLVAGVPYLIKTSATKENISFTEVQIENTTGSSVGADIKMYGIMSPTVLEASEKTHLIVVANDKLSWVTANDTQSLKGMRAYLKVENEQVQAAIRRNNPRLVLNGTDTATEMLNVNANANANRKLLINGQLYIEHNDRLYNVLGY